LCIFSAICWQHIAWYAPGSPDWTAFKRPLSRSLIITYCRGRSSSKASTRFLQNQVHQYSFSIGTKAQAIGRIRSSASIPTAIRRVRLYRERVWVPSRA
jgi:hypothetical protein